MYEYKFVRVDLAGIFTENQKRIIIEWLRNMRKKDGDWFKYFPQRFQHVGEVFQITLNSSSKEKSNNSANYSSLSTKFQSPPLFYSPHLFAT